MLKSFLEYSFPLPSGAGNPLPPNKNMKTSVHVRNNILNLLLRIVPALRLYITRSNGEVADVILDDIFIWMGTEVRSI